MPLEGSRIPRKELPQCCLKLVHQWAQITDQAIELHKKLFIGDWHAYSKLWSRDLSLKQSRRHLNIPIRQQQGYYYSNVHCSHKSFRQQQLCQKHEWVPRWHCIACNSLAMAARNMDKPYWESCAPSKKVTPYWSLQQKQFHADHLP